MRALAYIRVSTAEQAQQGHSLAQQPERAAAWCQARGLELVDVIRDEGVSASKPLHKRKGGAELLRRMAAGEADVVVVYALDRLFRDAQQGLNVLRGFDGGAGLPVQSITEPLDTTTAFGRFILTVWLAKGELERDQVSERTAAISAGLRQRGRKYGPVPYGVVARGGRFDEEQGRMVDQRLYRDPATWPTRAAIVHWHEVDGQTYRAIRQRLRRDRVAAPNGGEAWPVSTLAELVRTHASLIHLPLLPEDVTGGSAAAPDAPASTKLEEAAHG